MTNTSAQNEKDCQELILVRRAQTGDRAAFDRLAQHYRPLLFALAFLRTGHKEEAEDLVQEALTKAWLKLPTLTDTALFLPWLKSVTANACISWYRRVDKFPRSLEEDTQDTLRANKGLPLETLLEREKQWRLQQALWTLPEVNRLALVMRVWKGASYEDIAAFTGVPASTVDGRIYRAKRQLRRLLHDAGAEFFGEEPRPRQPKSHLNEFFPPRSSKMTIPETTATVPHWEQALALTLFTRRFSLMLNAGVTLSRTLELLQDIPAPYGAAARALRTQVEDGACLSRVMSEHPDLFSQIYIGMVRAGEVGGVLEETAQRLKKALAREWHLASRLPPQEISLFLLLPADRPLSEKWDSMSAYQQTMTFSLFFETFGTLLQSGVPILQAMETVAELLPLNSREGWMQAREQVTTGLPFVPTMARMGIFPTFALEMLRVGEECGSLDAMLHSLAEAFEDDLEYQLLPQPV